MSYPLIGNYGLADDDYDYKRVFINGYVVKENNDLPSNFRATRTLSDCMEENKVVGIEGLDTREIVKIIRDEKTFQYNILGTDTLCHTPNNGYREQKRKTVRCSRAS